MYSTNIKDLGKYAYLKDRFDIAFDFLKHENLKELPVGKINLDGDNVIVLVQEYETSAAESNPFEAHNRYFDIQFVASGREVIGLADRETLTAFQEYDEKKDMALYKDPELYGFVLLSDGDFAVIPPEEAHKPRCAAGKPVPVKKILVKVRV